jgi:solute carrier family 25 S-adenosylmethionine transporter 26
MPIRKLFALVLLVAALPSARTTELAKTTRIQTTSSSLQRQGGGGNGGSELVRGLQACVRRPGAWLRSPETREALKNGCASGLAAACAKTALQPFDSIKTVQQGSTVPLSMAAASRQLVERSGLGGLYSGLLVSIVGAMPSVFVYFAVYQYFKERLLARWAVPSSSSSSSSSALRGKCAAILCAAGLGNLVASFLRPPYEILKQRQQAGTDATLLAAVRRVYREQGLGGFWQGLSAQMARDILYAMATLLVYELLKQHAAASLEKKRSAAAAEGGAEALPVALTSLQNGVIGALAGGFGSFVTNPMDVVKTRMMVGKRPATALAAGSEGWWATVVSIAHEEEGAMAFWKGCAPRLLQKMPANAVFFLSYEFFRALLRVER